MNKDKPEDIVEDNDAENSPPPTDYQRKSEKDKDIGNM